MAEGVVIRPFLQCVVGGVSAAIVLLPVAAESGSFSDLAAARENWLRATATEATAELPRHARAYREAALEFLARRPAADVATAYGPLLATDGLVLREAARRRLAFAARPAGLRELDVAADALDHHVTTDPFQRVVDFRDSRFRVDVPAYPALDYAEGFTYAVWVQLAGQVQVEQTKIVSHAGVASGKAALMIGPGNRLLALATLTDGKTEVCEWSRGLPVGRWVHLALTFDRRWGLGLYVDGRRDLDLLRGSPHASGVGIASSAAQTLHLGGLDRILPGRLDDFRVYSRALEVSEVRELAAGRSIDHGLAGHWPLDRVVGEWTPNVVKGGLDGRVGSGVVLEPAGAPALRTGGALRFCHAERFWAEELARLEGRVDAAERALLRDMTPPRSTGAILERVLESLRERDAVLLHYVEDSARGRLHVFRLDPGATDRPLLHHLVPLAEVRLRQERLAAALESGGGSGPAGEARYRDAARDLARLLWDPVEDFLPPEGEVWLRLDGSVAATPFAALVDRDGRYLIERHAFGTAGPLAGHPGRRPDAGPPRLVAFGNPSFAAYPGIESRPLWLGRTQGDAIPAEARAGEGCLRPQAPLFGTHVEIRRIGELFQTQLPEAVAYEWDDAYENRLRRAATGADVLHIATHVYQLDPDCLPGRTRNAAQLVGLRLAGVDRARPDGSRVEDDGLLSGAELSRLDLSAARVLALSGCSTARVLSRPGSAGSSLPDAAWVAGAHATVATLWNVRDDAMPEVMLDFYEVWLSGASAPHALRRALMAARDRAGVDRGHTHPIHWAATVIEGL